jgi:hypothetical protein
MELLLPFSLLLALSLAAYRVTAFVDAVDDDDRAVIAAAFAPLAVVVAVQVLGRVSSVSRELLAAWLAATAVALLSVAMHVRPTRGRREVWRVGAFACAIAVLALVALGGSVTASALLDTWAWDSLGYHLPIAHDLLQTGTLREVPGHLAYIETYPRFVDLFTAGFRVLLGSERFVDLSQLPFVPLLVAAAFRHGRALGVTRSDALAFAIAPIAMPIVFLQCATSYVDVAYAALLVAGLGYLALSKRRTHDALAALFLGLALATKPSAPATLAVALSCAAVLRARAHGATGLRSVVLVAFGALLIGGKVYVDNVRRFGNPVWPIVLKAGGVSLPGYVTQDHILALGVTSEHQHLSWVGKLATSWFLEPSTPVFDMRFGGFGRAFAFVALPLALLAAARDARVRALLFIAVPACLAQSGAFTTRYTIAVATFAFVAAPIGLTSLAPALRRPARVAVAALLAFSLVHGFRGFSDNGPSLLELARMAPRDRAYAVAPDMRGDRWWDLRRALRPGEAFAYDKSFGLPSFAFRNDGTTRLVFLGDVAPTEDRLAAIVEREHVRFVAVDNRITGRLDERFVEVFPCGFDACTVYEVMPHARAGYASNE